jgi:hypothetical protein
MLKEPDVYLSTIYTLNINEYLREMPLQKKKLKSSCASLNQRNATLLLSVARHPFVGAWPPFQCLDPA